MKNLFYACLLNIALASYSYAEVIYCPQQIFCGEMDLSSCILFSPDKSLWHLAKQDEGVSDISGSYMLTNVQSKENKIFCLFRNHVYPDIMLITTSDTGYMPYTQSPIHQWQKGDADSDYVCPALDTWSKVTTYNCPIKKL